MPSIGLMTVSIDITYQENLTKWTYIPKLREMTGE